MQCGAPAKHYVILSAAKNPSISPLPSSALPGFRDDYFDDRSAPKGGIAPDLQARSGLAESSELGTDNLSFADRGIYHAADAMKDLYDMGDSPSCATCGSIMTRSGSCYRCMSCGSTSGCS